MQFLSLKDLTIELAERTIEGVKQADWDGLGITAKLGLSNQSPSAYVEISFSNDDGDYLEDTDGYCSFKVRFSDHADRYGSDVTIRIDRASSADEEGEVEIDDWKYDICQEQAMDAIRSYFGRLDRETA